MQNALQEPQTIVLLGGTSEIGRAIVDELLAPVTRTLVLACRHPDTAQPERFAREGLTVDVVAFDAAETGGHEQFVRELAARHGDLDVVIVAFGVLGSQEEFDADPEVRCVAFRGAEANLELLRASELFLRLLRGETLQLLDALEVSGRGRHGEASRQEVVARETRPHLHDIAAVSEVFHVGLQEHLYVRCHGVARQSLVVNGKRAMLRERFTAS